MAATGETEQKQNLRHQEVGHKSLLQSDALYQVIPCFFLSWFLPPKLDGSCLVFPKIFIWVCLIFQIFDLGFFFFYSKIWFGFCFCSIYLRLACTQESRNRWKNWERWLRSIHGELWDLDHSISDFFIFLGEIVLILNDEMEIGTSWPLPPMKGSSWTCFWSWSTPRTPWKSVSTPVTLFSPQPLPSLMMER